MAKDMIFGSFLFVWFLWSIRAIMASQEGKKKNGRASDFNWKDDEIQLLFEVCFDFKAESNYEGVKWESKRTKNEQIKSKFCNRYPELEDEKFSRSDDLDSITKEWISDKLKSIRTNFKNTVDTGKKSGGGRIIFTFYELCERIWGGCPTVNSISHGIHQLLKKKHRKMNQCKTNYDESSTVQSN